MFEEEGEGEEGEGSESETDFSYQLRRSSFPPCSRTLSFPVGASELAQRPYTYKREKERERKRERERSAAAICLGEFD